MTDKKKPAPRPGGPATAPGGEGAVEAASGSAGSARKRSPNVKDHIGRQLRAIYDEVASQPVPDRFMELLNRLDVKRGEE